MAEKVALKAIQCQFESDLGYMSPRKYGNTEEEYRDAVATSISVAEVCRKLGIIPIGGNFGTVKRNIAKYDLDASHFTGTAQPFTKFDLEHSPPKSKASLKKYLIHFRGHKCEKCFNDSWLGIPIALELEHIDGNTCNNNLSNLLLLCPNCHAQTDTWRRPKNNTKIKDKEKKRNGN